MGFWAIFFLLLAGVAVAIVALFLRIIKNDEVAIADYFGILRAKVLGSGPRLLLRFPGIRLVRFTKNQIPFTIGGEAEHDVFSSDRQLLLVDVSGYLRFPFEEPGSLILMTQSGVPRDRVELDKWIQEEVLAGLRDIMADFTHEEAIKRSNLTSINKLAKEFFLRPEGLFAKSGICGNDRLSFTLGTGEVLVRVDTVRPTKSLQEAMQAPVVEKYKAEAAQHTAMRNAQEVGTQIMYTAAIIAGVDVNDVAKLAEFMEKIRRDPTLRSKPAADGGYKEVFLAAQDQVKRDRTGAGLTDIRLGGTDGGSLPPSLTTLVVGGGGSAGIIVGQGGGNQGKKRGKKRDKLQEAADEGDEF